MNLNEAVKYLAERGINRDRSTVSKWLKAIGVRAKFGLIQKEALDKLIKLHAKKEPVKIVQVDDSPSRFFTSLNYAMITAPRFGLRVTVKTYKDVKTCLRDKMLARRHVRDDE